MIIGKYNDYRKFLKETLERRIQNNSKYSLRAFARDLSVAPQNLSSVLNGKRGISLETALKLTKRLDLAETEASYFCDLVDLNHAKSPEQKQIALLRLSRYKQGLKFQTISTDTLRIISDWYHFAILELTFISGFKSDTKWIAKKLKISNHEAQQAVDRLLRTNLLVESNGTLIKSSSHLTTTHDVPSDAIKSFNRQILQKAMDSIVFQSVADRDFTTMTMAIDPTKIPEAKSKIRAFRREITEFLEAGDRSEVYCFSQQLFRLTEKKIGEK